MAAQLQSFFRFVLGFSVFVAVSLGLTFAVGTYAIKKDKSEQTAAALEAMINPEDAHEWWEFWK